VYVIRTFFLDGILSLPNATVYLLYALGIVVIYRASRVINLAHGAMAMAPAYLFTTLARSGVPLPIAVVMAVGFGAVLGLATEGLVVRRLRRQGPTAQTVGTAAVFGLVVALVAKIYGTAPIVPPSLFPRGTLSLGTTGLRYGQIIVFILGIVIAAGLFALFRFTKIGLAMRGAADNRRGAALMGVDVDRTTQIAWALGGALAGLAGTFVGSLTNIHPYTLSFQVLPAFVAVLLGGLESLPGAVWASAVVGLVQGEVPALVLIPGLSGLASSVGFPQAVLMILTFAVMATRGKKLVGSRVRDEGLGASALAPTVAAEGADRRRRRPLLIALAIAGFPFIPGLPFSLLGDSVLAMFYLAVALSLVLLVGWVGQISLAQAELVGVGAFMTAVLANKLHIPFPVSFPIAALLAALVAAALGMVALRVRGLYLAVATLVFAAMADTFLFNSSWFGIEGGSASIKLKPLGTPKAFPYFDFNSVRLIYFIFLAFGVFCIYGLANIRESKTGRALFAVRGSEVAAASFGVDVTRYKLLAFAMAGAIAGGAGSLYMVYFRSAVPDTFNILASLFFLSVAVVGGLSSLGGAIFAALLFAALQEVFFRVQALAGFLNVVSSALLMAVLLLYPGGMAAVPRGLAALRARWRGSRMNAFRGRLLERLPLATRESEPALAVAVSSNGSEATRSADEPPETAPPPWAGFGRSRPVERGGERPESVVLRASGVTVRFGGLTAVRDLSLEVREREIVGLMGPNGAGKTTLFNVIAGLTAPQTGRVELLGTEATSLPVHVRAKLGLARTFQDIQLFPQLSVFENLLVATHVHNASTLPQHLMVSDKATKAEREARDLVASELAFLGLSELGHKAVADLSFGQLRMVEVARALVTGARVIMLDEPASGLDNTESDRLVDLLLHVREERQVSMLVVEHDVRTLVALADYLYAMAEGALISEGRPDEVQQDEAVVRVYLGETLAVTS
jgi:ABC-type branched-subunit amino acid transport system ATPase component/branched-subunit amino acid ABC-type transport system permease component